MRVTLERFFLRDVVLIQPLIITFLIDRFRPIAISVLQKIVLEPATLAVIVALSADCDSLCVFHC